MGETPFGGTRSQSRESADMLFRHAFRILVPVAVVPMFLVAQSRDALRLEEEEDYFKRWLTEDVVYIITPEEKAVFEALTTPEEKELFIEQFWFRRDPDSRTSENQYKEEHYRRIAYANENFQAGMQGWRTDRGRVYIIHGPPDEIRSHSAGETYNRPMHEGGGTTNVYPFEVWRYRHIPGIGDDVELEFVDRSFSGFYKLVFSPWEKDLLLMIDNAGQTQAEELGLARRENHPFFNPDRRNIEAYPFLYFRAKDDPFARYELFNQIQRPLEIKYNDLKEMVEINVTYDNLDFGFRADYFVLSPGQLLLPLTLQWENKDLTFQMENGAWTARLAVYGIIRSLSRRVLTEFEDDVVVRFDESQRRLVTHGKSVFQKGLTVDRGSRYRLDLVVKDLNSGRIGTRTVGLVPPRIEPDTLGMSHLMLSDFIRQMFEDSYRDSQMFLLGDLWIRPSLDGAFPEGQNIGVYFHLYNISADQTTFQPSLEVTYRIVRDGEVVSEQVDRGGQTVHYWSPSRTVLLHVLGTGQLPPGSYRLEVEATDRLRPTSVTGAQVFEIVDAAPRVASR
jgi:GWxTD domain-containing protein